MTHTIITLQPNGERTQKFAKPDYETIRDEIGGYIERPPYFTSFEGHRCTAYCDEEGKLKRLQPNAAANKAWYACLLKKFGTKGIAHWNDTLCGPVVITIKGQIT